MTTREILESFEREEGIALFNAKKTDKEVYDLLVSKGLTDSFDTFVSEAEKIFNEKVCSMRKDELFSQIEGAELTDEQLEQVAGGEKGYDEVLASWIAPPAAIVGTAIIASSAGALA